MKPAIKRDSFMGDVANTFLLRPSYRPSKGTGNRKMIVFQVIVAGLCLLTWMAVIVGVAAYLIGYQW